MTAEQLVSEGRQYDAVCHLPHNRALAYQLVKPMPEEERLRRRRRWPFAGRATAKPMPGLMLWTSFCGHAQILPDDFTWEQIEEDFWVGTLKEGVCESKRVSDEARDEAARDVLILKSIEQSKSEDAAKRAAFEELHAQWKGKAEIAMFHYCVALCESEGIDPDELNPEQMCNRVKLIHARTGRAADMAAFVINACGPEPDLDIPKLDPLPDELANDFWRNTGALQSRFVRRKERNAS